MTYGRSSDGNYAVALMENKTRGLWDAVEAVGDLYRIIDFDSIPECDWDRVNVLEEEARKHPEAQ